MRKVTAPTPEIQIVTFRVGSEEFGLDVLSVHEVLRYEPVTPVPRAPAFVEGVADVRGTLVPVIDLRRRFELAGADHGPDTRILVVSVNSERLGLVVDQVMAVQRVPESAVSEPPEYVRGIAAEFIHGVIKLDDRLVVLIDIDRILSSDERITLAKADLG